MDNVAKSLGACLFAGSCFLGTAAGSLGRRTVLGFEKPEAPILPLSVLYIYLQTTNNAAKYSISFVRETTPPVALK